ncbi:MAG: amino acid permease [Phycisphaerae bacterium]|nr:amino acid permease [Phycisphaerae bacterium]
MLVAENRPRNLSWLHAGPLLYGDWGTSRLYVLGLAFFFAAHGSVLFLAGIGLVMIAVAWAYTIICRSFPDGGGVYTAARQINPTLAVVGSTLLLGGYIMTAAISVVEAFHYFGAPRGTVLGLSMASLALIGVVNWLGARSAGRFALVIAIAALVVSGLVALACLPFVPAGLGTISLDALPPPGASWVIFTKICLAMAGIEAVANMTGLMKQPVARTSKRTIAPVLIEVVALNLLFGVALAGIPGLVDKVTPDAAAFRPGTAPADVLAYRDTAMKALAIESGRHWLGAGAGYLFGKVSAVVFGLLLLSAANTAVMAMVSVLYAMAHERELPKGLTRLNYSGVPWIGLVVSLVACAGVLLIEHDVQILAELYVIGVCGAVTTTVLCAGANRGLEIPRRHRAVMAALGLFLLAVTLTIALTKPRATAFAGVLVASVLVTRSGLRLARRGEPEMLPEPTTGWLAEVKRGPVKFDARRPRIMLAARGRDQAQFAVELARRQGATLFALYVRTLRVMDYNATLVPRIEEDKEAQESLGTASLLAGQAGIPFVPIYVISTDIAGEILDYTVTFGCDTLIMGKTRRSVLSRAVAGDVVARVAQLLPAGVTLLTRAAGGPAEFVPTGPNGAGEEERGPGPT